MANDDRNVRLFLTLAYIYILLLAGVESCVRAKRSGRSVMFSLFPPKLFPFTGNWWQIKVPPPPLHLSQRKEYAK